MFPSRIMSDPMRHVWCFRSDAAPFCIIPDDASAWIENRCVALEKETEAMHGPRTASAANCEHSRAEHSRAQQSTAEHGRAANSKQSSEQSNEQRELSKERQRAASRAVNSVQIRAEQRTTSRAEQSKPEQSKSAEQCGKAASRAQNTKHRAPS